MKFRRCTYAKDYVVEITDRKVAAAKRRLARQRDRVALLPDLVADVPSLEVEVARTVAGSNSEAKWWRDRWAQNWRDARRRLALLPSTARAGVLRYWNHWVDNDAPGSPEYFATIVEQAHKGISFWARLAELRRLKLIGEKRLPFKRADLSEPWRRRDWQDRDVNRFRQKRARRLGAKIELQAWL